MSHVLYSHCTITDWFSLCKYSGTRQESRLVLTTVWFLWNVHAIQPDMVPSYVSGWTIYISLGRPLSPSFVWICQAKKVMLDYDWWWLLLCNRDHSQSVCCMIKKICLLSVHLVLLRQSSLVMGMVAHWSLWLAPTMPHLCTHSFVRPSLALFS